MKIAITAIGTRGDLQPYIALGLGLKNEGHQVLIVSAKNEENFVHAYGLDFYPIRVDIQELMEGDKVQEMAKGSNPLKFIIGHLKNSKALKALMVETQGEIWNACQDADLIIFHPGMPIGFFLAKERGRKSILASPFPVVATKDYPSILFYSMPRLGTAYNLLTHYIFDKVFWAMAKSSIREFWSKKSPAKINFNVSPIQQQIKSGMPVLNGYSKHLFHQPEEWPANIHTTGSWTIPEESSFTPSPDLESFINAGEPPVYVGFGSMKDISSFKTTFEIILHALENTKQRAVIGLGWTKLNYNQPIPDNVLLIESVPHTWLFPKMKLVVHHGGAGTTSTGLMAGKPTIIIPHIADQPAWGQRVYELKVGAKPIPKKKLSADKLREAIIYALQPHIIENARVLGQKLQGEKGVQQAVKIITKMFKDEERLPLKTKASSGP